MLQYIKITTSNLNWTETHTILPTFLGSTQKAHMGASCVLPSVTSLTGRSVCWKTDNDIISVSEKRENVKDYHFAQQNVQELPFYPYRREEPRKEPRCRRSLRLPKLKSTLAS